WAALVDAGLTALPVSEEAGGAGLGFTEVAVVVEALGRRASDLPYGTCIAAGLIPLLAHGGPEDLIAAVVAGEALLVPVIDGRDVSIPEVGLPLYFLEPSEAGLSIFDSEGVSIQDTPSSSGQRVATVRLGGSPLHVLGTEAAAAVRDHYAAAQVVQASGLLAGALELTAGYIKEREQFGRQLAQFQAVAQQIADVFIEARMVSVLADELVRRVAAGEPAGDDLAIAAWVVTDRLPRAMRTCHHLHGGMGVDITYPLPGFSERITDIGRTLGGMNALAGVPMRETEGKNLELTPDQRAYKDEARAYFGSLTSREDRIEMLTDRHGDAYHRNIKKMGADGWMGVGWPVEYGGQGRGGIEQQIFANEASYADVHLPSVTLQTVGPTLQAYGTEKQKDMFLKDILAGDVHFAIGYSEADAGTDLASLRCAARKDPATGDWIVNGQKMWTTGGHAADYIWIAVRTDPDAPKHKGISVLILDTRDPGYSWTPIVTLDGSHHVNATYYNDVRVPADMLVGEENGGWSLITTQLNHERVMLGPAGRLEGLRDIVLEWAADRSYNGTPLLEIPAVREVFARCTVAFRLNELLNWQVAGGHASGGAAVADASSSKVFASAEIQEIGPEMTAIVATYGDATDPETAYLLDYLDRTARRNLVLTFGGGVNEVQRELIAMFGLGLPKVPR
ncbi:MAG TPA: acyl-CoA dehydrogenase, partial [Marmoricola sp.]|nr:acyl-CoA dehydrogenase [Marmoricola sp.]